MIGTKNKEDKTRRSQVSTPNSLNIIGTGTGIKGDVNSDGDVRIDGKLEGNIYSKGKVLVGKSGTINGNIECNNSEISGYVSGKMLIKDLLTIKASANIKGDIITSKLSVEPGAKFNGTCKMNNTNEVLSGQKFEKPKKSD